MGVNMDCPHEWSIVQEFPLLSFGLTSLTQLVTNSLVFRADFKRETAFFLPACPLRLIFQHNMNQRLTKSAFAQIIRLPICFGFCWTVLLILLCKQFCSLFANFLSKSSLFLGKLEQVFLLHTDWICDSLREDHDLDHESFPKNWVIHLKREQGQLGKEFGVFFNDSSIRLLNTLLCRLEVG